MAAAGAGAGAGAAGRAGGAVRGGGQWPLLLLLLLLTGACLAAGEADLYISRSSKTSRELHVACVVTKPRGSVRHIRVKGGGVLVTSDNATAAHVGINVTTGVLQATVTPTHCDDLSFQCHADLADEVGFPDSIMMSRNFSFLSEWEPPRISPRPEPGVPLREGEEVQLGCQANTSGSKQGELQMAWKMERGGTSLPASQCGECAIAQRHLVEQNSRGCSRSLTSSLRYRVTSGDNGLLFRCVLQSPGGAVEAMSAPFVVVLDCPPAPKRSDLGFTVVVSIAAFLLILVIALLVGIIKRRRRSGQHDLEKKSSTGSSPDTSISSVSSVSSGWQAKAKAEAEETCYAKVGEGPYLAMASTAKLLPLSRAADDTYVKELSRNLPLPPLPGPSAPPEGLEGLCKQGGRLAPQNVYQNGDMME